MNGSRAVGVAPGVPRPLAGVAVPRPDDGVLRPGDGVPRVGVAFAAGVAALRVGVPVNAAVGVAAAAVAAVVARGVLTWAVGAGVFAAAAAVGAAAGGVAVGVNSIGVPGIVQAERRMLSVRNKLARIGVVRRRRINGPGLLTQASFQRQLGRCVGAHAQGTSIAGRVRIAHATGDGSTPLLVVLTTLA